MLTEYVVVVNQIGKEWTDVKTYVHPAPVAFKLFIWFVTKKLRVKKTVMTLLHQESGGVNAMLSGVKLRRAASCVE